MNSIKQSIKKTIEYSEYFGYRLSAPEIYYWLISSKAISYQDLKPHLQEFSLKNKKQLNSYSQIKIKKAKWLTFIPKIIPTIKFIGITGSVAANNALEGDDTDIIIITSTNTLWLSRFFVTLILTVTNKRRLPKDRTQNLSTSFCLNLWLDESSLVIPEDKQNLYSAREILQIKPLYDPLFVHQKLIISNPWIEKYHANAYRLLTSQNFSHSISFLSKLSSFLLTPLNYLFYQLQLLYMKPKITNETISYHSAYFHPILYYHRLKKSLKWIS